VQRSKNSQRRQPWSHEAHAVMVTVRSMGGRQWARRVSNLRPLACEASALPLSYAP
jgi:hypothetical protein